jgi:hypothetical protein
MKVNNNILLPSFSLSYNALLHAIGPKVDKYEVELLHHALTHIHKHGILIYKKGLNTLKNCDKKDIEDSWHAVRFLSIHFNRLSLLSEFATELLRSVDLPVGDFRYDAVSEEINFLKQQDNVIQSIPRIFSTKFTETEIDDLDELDLSLKEIYGSFLFIYLHLIPRLNRLIVSGSNEVGEFVSEIDRALDHMVGHCNHHMDAFFKLLPYLEDKLRKLH